MKSTGEEMARHYLEVWRRGGPIFRHQIRQMVEWLHNHDPANCPDCGHDRRDCRIAWGPDQGDGRDGLWECRECGSVERVEQVWSDRIEAI